MNNVFQISIDGPSGAGKSTIAKHVAGKLGLDYVDTGAMYRALGLKMIRENINPENRQALEVMLEGINIDFSDGHVMLDGEDVSELIRNPEVSKMASLASALPEVREKLVQAQKDMGKGRSVVMDGRDIGNNVLPNANCKIFLTASVKVRAERRWMELVQKGKKVTLKQVEDDLIERDFNDINRKLNPLRKAHDAIEIDTTTLSIEEVVDKILSLCKR